MSSCADAVPSSRSIQPVRRVPAPRSEPPYDDEAVNPAGALRPDDVVGLGVQGTLALAFVLPSGLPTQPAPAPGLRLVPPLPPEDEESHAVDVDFGPQPTGRAALPDPRGWSARLVQAMVDVLGGVRPVAQLVRWTTADVYDELGSRVTSPPATTTPAPRAVVRSVHVSEPADGVAEVAACVRRGMRTTAIALRLEGLDGRWQCTALDLG
jgi:hypothetical protein